MFEIVAFRQSPSEVEAFVYIQLVDFSPARVSTFGVRVCCIIPGVRYIRIRAARSTVPTETTAMEKGLQLPSRVLTSVNMSVATHEAEKEGPAAAGAPEVAPREWQQQLRLQQPGRGVAGPAAIAPSVGANPTARAPPPPPPESIPPGHELALIGNNKSKIPPEATLSAAKAKPPKQLRTEGTIGLMYTASPGTLERASYRPPAGRDPRVQGLDSRAVDAEGFRLVAGGTRNGQHEWNRATPMDLPTYVNDIPDLEQLQAVREVMGFEGLRDYQNYDGLGTRNCQDQVCNFFGAQLGALCRSEGLLVMNGRMRGDLEGRLTFP
ncbi:hypothetical protein VOLCADRAFT_91834 [Volvox carteri f. nagariensis]|uniref:Uncharacterized protein n=1 Tax=Volvox carteri f. nagariensis TaxID=3068 RepID=D8TY29_VOLCA|nr:uncharacterized protein VOLCADRAFT_91834 [Volvox carteri f. nagariensis]EFJ47572.1 hypothetical protein VOLCADRAFT_91834 [Volvox carteri f. nagariensis]|eukprot:XP_002951396.1 hypothetical protein VOLCADRAFT_91834 [Volvox carteri f. nagariensis]